MNADDLLDHALGQTEGRRRFEVDVRLRDDAAAANRVERIRQALDDLLDDGQDPAPPSNLARRTIMMVEARRQRPMILDYVPTRTPWRWADLAVAAGIFLAGMVTLLPALQRTRSAATLAACSDNLRQIGRGLLEYATEHREMPQPGPGSDIPYPGATFSRLVDLEMLNRNAVYCPAYGSTSASRSLPSTGVLRHLVSSGSRPPACLQDLDYAVNVGYFDQRAWRAPSSLPSALVPLAADQPLCDQQGHALAGNSPNHGSKGQNVLCSDLHVGYFPGRKIGSDPDMYLNRMGHTAPGIYPDDHVLGAAHLQISTHP